ncbi:MAG: Ger(x)C family spore germination protein [Bacillota bacterium]
MTRIRNVCFRITLIALIISITSVTMTGCWNRREPVGLLFPTLLGFDIDETGEYIVFAQFPNPTVASGAAANGGGGGRSLSFWVNIGRGQTPYSALKDLALTTSRLISLTHVTVLLISEKLARQGIGPIVELFLRNHELRLIVRTAIVEGSITDLLESELPLEPTPGLGMHRMLEFIRDERSQIPEGNLLEKLREMAEPGHDPMFMRMTVLPAAKEQSFTDPGTTQGEMAKPIVKIHGSAVFRKDKMVGWLDDHESGGANWVLGTISRATYVVAAPQHDCLVTIELLQRSREVKPLISGDEIGVNVKIGAIARVQDITGRIPVDRDDRETVEWLTQEVVGHIENDVQLALSKARELGADVFGFGNLIYRKEPRVWEQIGEDRWHELFQTLKVNVDVEVHVRRPGLVISSFTPR